MTEFICLVQSLGGSIEIAHAKTDVTDGVVGHPDRIQEMELLELVTGLACVLLRLRPSPVEHLQFGAMDAADPRVAAGAVPSHPSLAGIRPLRRSVEITQGPARAHTAA